jgi:adenylate cyclase
LERRLAAILAADVVGYTRLMGEDEAGTLRRLTELRQEILEPLINEHHGRVVKLMGDGLLVEFASVVNALTCAVAWQNGVAERETAADEDKRFKFRIGINLGDVIVEGGDIHGDGVNVAARLEGLAEPGGICISDMVHQNVSTKLNLSFEDLGEQALKNIDKKVRVWHWAIDGSVEAKGSWSTSNKLSLPDKPSIAVLPFENMSDDPEQEYFTDGITEDIITALSKTSKLFVIARNSTLIYKGRALDIKQVAREQGVRYVLEGSVRRGGKRMRITAQLIEAASGHHLWAQRYDREVADIFALQDEITKEVVSALQIELTEGEQARLAARGTESLEAWQLTFQARTLLHAHHQDGMPKAADLLEQALQLDPNYALAWGSLAGVHWSQALNEGWSASREGSLELAMKASDRSLAIDPEVAGGLTMRGLILLSYRDFDGALAHAEKALFSAHNLANTHAAAAIILLACGKPAEAIKRVKKAIRLCPIYPAWFLWQLGASHWALGQSDEAIATARSGIESDPDLSYSYVLLAMVYAETDRVPEARNAAAEVLRIDPDFSASTWAKGMPFSDPELEARQLSALRKSGLPG